MPGLSRLTDAPALDADLRHGRRWLGEHRLDAVSCEPMLSIRATFFAFGSLSNIGQPGKAVTGSEGGGKKSPPFNGDEVFADDQRAGPLLAR